ncbi:MAG: efflux RND transporter periplasmic adaptor subunit [Planctomycetes bacterium]|nr:efflux RND transporter periplasmic adaptor subunit [Planctomycetota bacterium]
MKFASFGRIAFWLIVAALAAIGVYRFKFARVPVTKVEAQAGLIVAETMGTGTLEARVKTTISPRIQERLAEVLMDQNDVVKAGQLLARLDDGELKQQVEVATASLAWARASVERVKAEEVRAQAVLQQAKVNQKRVAELQAGDIASEGELDKAMEQLNVAEADVKRAQAAIVEADYQVRTAEENLRYQEERLGFTRIVSPYDGMIVRRDRDPGGVVVPGGSLLQLISTDEIWVSAWVDEVAAAALAPGQPARVVFRSEPGRSYTGEVARLGRETDRETREFLVDVRVKALPMNWTVGQRAEVYIETGRKPQAVVVPQGFVQWRGGKPGVFVSAGGKARWRAVLLGLRGQDVVEIAEGVAAGEVLVKPAEAKVELADGQRVAAP